MTADRTEAVTALLKLYTHGGEPFYGGTLSWGATVPEMLAAADAHDRANGIVRIRPDEQLAEKIADRLHMTDCGCGGNPDPWYVGHARVVLDLLRGEAL